MDSWAQYIGYAAGFLTIVSFLPQVLKAWRTRQVKDLSLGMFLLLGAGGVLWLVYGVMIGDWPVIITNAAMLAQISAILVAKVRSG